MKLESILRDVKIQEWNGPRDIEVGSVAFNSKLLLRGGLFCTWKGENSDGHRFIPEAVSKGASAVVVERDVEAENCSRIVVPSGRAALSVISANFYSRPAEKLCMIGVTGTNGKTSTAMIVQSLLNQFGTQSGLIGTIHFDLGNATLPANHTTPEGLDLQRYLDTMVQNGCKACVMEVSSHALAQGRVEGVPYNVAIFTNLTQDHLDFHGTMENYFQSKLSLFTSLKEGQSAVVNADDARCNEIVSSLAKGVKAYTFGFSEKADFRADEVELSRTGTKFKLISPERSFDVSVPWLGRFNVQNILSAITAVHATGFSVAQIVKHLNQLPHVNGRMELVPHAGDFSVVVDYAHTDDAVRKVLGALRPLVTGKLKIIVGCGGNRDKAKRPLMAQAACELADEVIFTSDNPRKERPEDILNDMLAGVATKKNFKVIQDRAEAISQGITSCENGDILLIAGKGHESMQEIMGIKHPFSDREVALDILSGKGGK